MISQPHGHLGFLAQVAERLPAATTGSDMSMPASPPLRPPEAQPGTRAVLGRSMAGPPVPVGLHIEYPVPTILMPLHVLLVPYSTCPYAVPGLSQSLHSFKATGGPQAR